MIYGMHKHNITNKQVNIEVAVIWIVFFAFDLFLLWITAESPFK